MRLVALAVVGAARSAPAGPATGLELVSARPLDAREFVQPVALAAAPLGRLFVADLGRGAVVRVDSAGRAVFEFESPPDQPGLQPLDLEVTGFQVYVLDAQANALLRFTDQGSFLDLLQSFRDEASATPRALSVDRAGRVLLADPARHRVRLLDETQRTETLVGGFGSRPGEMRRPQGVAFAPGGAFYVADTGNARLQRFGAVGNFEIAFGDSLGEPRGLAVGATGEIYVADPARRVVQLYGPGGTRRVELALARFVPTDVAVVGDTLWVLCIEPNALLRLRVRRGG